MSNVALVSGLAMRVSPQGHLCLEETAEASPLNAALEKRLLAAFEKSTGDALLQLGAKEPGAKLSADLGFFQSFATCFMTAVCATPSLSEKTAPLKVAPPSFEALALELPPMRGSEYVTPSVLAGWWQSLTDAFNQQFEASLLSADQFIKRLNAEWHLVGRVYFNLAENRRDDETPFAFMATFTPKLSVIGRVQHVPLGSALRDYVGAKNQQQLLTLLLPMKRAGEALPWLKALVTSGDVFHPLRWSPPEAYQFIQDVPALEAAGIIVRLPASWKSKRPARAKASAEVGTHAPGGGLGGRSLLDFSLGVTLEGERLTAEEVQALLAGVNGLTFLRGKWVEVDTAKLQSVLSEFEAVQLRAESEGLSFYEAMRLVAGVGVESDAAQSIARADWAQVSAGLWLAETLKQLRAPGPAPERIDGLKASLRPYQREGVQWLHLLTSLGLGGCLADDMGLGKTIQVLALLLRLKESAGPSVLVAPASLLSNWAAEIASFAPDLKTMVVHPSVMASAAVKSLEASSFTGINLVMTSYGSLLRAPAMASMQWHLAIIDEAQAIKNPNAQQTRLVKKLKAKARIALTGTPVENRLSDLWSIFDFINPGLLGTSKEFATFAKTLAQPPAPSYAPLRQLVQPYILRRLKTDKSVIADLPDKTEVKAYCQLSKKQAALYQLAVKGLQADLQQSDGMKRRGVVLSYLMRFKQICNHPSQYLNDGEWLAADSGKLTRLRELAEVIAAKQEKVLVFTQFRETTAALDAFLSEVFGLRGVVLHGATEVAKRRTLVEAFQNDQAVPYFVLSLKAGGSGLNLTAASHVIHFDRWWNPAVENQATDRAFRIGQKKNVLVQKFVCQGTVEDKIDELIESKRGLTRDVLEGGKELALTELGDDELLSLVSLDLKRAGAAL